MSHTLLRRKLMLSSMAGVVAALALLGYAFHIAEGDSPVVTPGAPTSCPAPDCSACLHQVCFSHPLGMMSCSCWPALTSSILLLHLQAPISMSCVLLLAFSWLAVGLRNLPLLIAMHCPHLLGGKSLS